MKNRFVCIICCLLALCVLAPAPAFAYEEDPGRHFEYPTLAVAEAKYTDASGDGTVRAVITLAFREGEGEYTADRAENVRVRIECLNGLHADREEIFLGTVWDEQSFSISLSYADPETKDDADGRPRLKVHISSENCGKTEYTAALDTQPQARVVTVRQASEGSGLTVSLPQDQKDAEQIFHNGFAANYDGIAVRSPSGREIDVGGLSYKDLIDWIAQDGEDENDIAFICFITHGAYDQNKNYASTEYLFLFDGKETQVTYEEVLSYIDQKVKGRAVIVFDNCYSGHAIQAARKLGLDEERFAVITATNAEMPEPTSRTLSAYGETTMLAALFNKLQREGHWAGAAAHTVYDFEGLALRWDEIILQGTMTVTMTAPARLVFTIVWLLEDPVETGIRKQEGENFLGGLKNRMENLKDGAKQYLQDLEEYWKTILRPARIDTKAGESLAEQIEASREASLRNRMNKLITHFNLDFQYMPSQIAYGIANLLYSGDVPNDQMSWFNQKMEEVVNTSVGIMHPQFYGNMSLPLFVYAEDYDDEFRLPTLKSEEDEAVSYVPPEKMKITVLDAETEAPLAGAAVTLRTDENPSYTRTVYTDEAGECRLCGAARVYDLKAEIEGYEDAETKINFGARLDRSRLLLEPRKEALQKYADYLNRVCVPRQKLAALGAFDAGEQRGRTISDDMKLFSGRQYGVTGLLSAVFLSIDPEEQPMMLTVSAEYGKETGTISFPLSLYAIREGRVTLLSTDTSLSLVTYSAGETQRLYFTVYRDDEGNILAGYLLDYNSTWAGEHGQSRGLFAVKKDGLEQVTWEDERMRAFYRCPIESGSARIQESQFITDMRASGNVLCQVNYTSYLESQYANEDCTGLREMLLGVREARLTDPGPLAAPVNRID